MPGIELRERAERHEHAIARLPRPRRPPHPTACRSSTEPRSEPIMRVPLRWTAAAIAASRREPSRCVGGDRGLQRRPPPVAHRERERIGGVGRAGHLAQAEEPRHHLLHLSLAGAAVAGDRELHLVGAVLHHRDVLAARDREREPARLPHRHRGAGVHLEQHPLHRDRHRPRLGDQRVELGGERGEAVRERIGRRRCGSRRRPWR